MPVRSSAGGRVGPRTAAIASVLLLASAVCSGCATGESSPAGVTIDTVGGQILVQNPADMPSTITHSRAELTWVASEGRFENPHAVFPWDDTSVIVLDLDQLEAVTLGNEHRRLLGRPGSGPGEYRSVTGVAVWPPDSLAVWDARLARISVFTQAGAIVRTVMVPPPGGYPNAVRASAQLASWSSGIVLPRFGLLSIGKPLMMLLGWTSLSTDSVDEIATLAEEPRAFVEGIAFSRDPFGPRAIVSASGAFLGYTDGVEYCIHVVHDTDQLRRRVCKDWDRVRVDGAVAHLDVEALASELDLNPVEKAVLRARAQHQEVGELRNSINRLVMQDDGGFWVQVADEREKRLDPFLMRQYAEYGPALRRWDLYDSTGRWTATIDVPGKFEPWIVSLVSAVGILELPSGARTLGKLSLRKE
jgi:hypothetical protein